MLAERARRETLTSEQAVEARADVVLGQAVIAAFERMPAPVQALLRAEDGGGYRRWAPGGTRTDGIAELLHTAFTAGSEALLKERLPQIRAELRAALTRELNGEALADEPSPDTRPGQAGATRRVITDADVARMPLNEFNALFDERGLPRPGVEYRRGPGRAPPGGGRAA